MNVAGVHRVANPTYGWLGIRQYDRMKQLLNHVDKTDGCWLWTGDKLKNGYPTIIVQGRRILAHRQSYELHIGPIPVGLTLDHLCRTPLCVNPAHLEPVTLRENVLRAAKLNRPSHCKHGHSLEDAYPVRRKNGAVHRQCRPCRLASAKAYYAAKSGRA